MDSTNEPRTHESQAIGLLQLFQAFFTKTPTPTGLQRYSPVSSDTIISTHGKAGTTLLQNLTYHLAYFTVLAPDSSVPPLDTFDDISVAAPWLEYYPEMGVSLPAKHPRIFKTHAPFTAFAPFQADPTTAPRHIVVVRSPEAYPASFLDFLFDEISGAAPGAKDPAVREAVFHLIVRRHILGASPAAPRPWFDHVGRWISPPHPNILVLFYEDVVENLPATIRSVAAFMQIPHDRVTDDVVARVATACARETMTGDPRFSGGVEAKCMGLGNVCKVMGEPRKDSFKQWKFTDEELAELRTVMKEELGYGSYDEFKEATKKLQKEKYNR